MQIVFVGTGGFFEDRVTIRGLAHALPRGMMAEYTVRRDADGDTVSGFTQARDKHGRRYFSLRGPDAELTAQARLLKWSQRVLASDATQAPKE